MIALTEATRLKRTIAENGIIIPNAAYRAHVIADVPLWTICAFLMQETDGGQNVYGHDVDVDGYPRPFWGHGPVTEHNYRAYLLERDLGVRVPRFTQYGRRSQGVGPMQLTFWAYQDAADAIGGCWNPGANVITGANVLHDLKITYATWRKVALRYNGRPSYADQMVERFDAWRKITGGV